MKPNGLMIGNLTSHGEVIEIREDGATCMDHLGGIATFDYAKLSGIPLTDYWLLKFGFEYQAGFIKDSYWFLNKLYLTKYFQPFNQQGSLISYDLKYVHQLQNVYSSLTGEQLNIK